MCIVNDSAIPNDWKDVTRETSPIRLPVKTPLSFPTARATELLPVFVSFLFFAPTVVSFGS